MRKKWQLTVMVTAIYIGIIICTIVGFRLFVNFQKQKDQTSKIKSDQTIFPSPLSQILENNSFLFSKNKWTLLVTGDIIPARSVNFIASTKNGFMWPFLGIKDVLQNADLTLINLESPLIPNCPLTNEGMKFCGDQRFGQSLVDVGIDVVNLSNNHSLNYGWEGISETEDLLNKLGIETTGFYSSLEMRVLPLVSPKISPELASPALCQNNIYCSKVVIKEVSDTKIAFLGYNTVGQKLDREIVHEQIADAKKKSDLIIVSIHWGSEYSSIPKPEMEDPIELGKWLVDEGVDIVVGNHPHQIQPVEYYQDKLILYAMGNTVFDQEWSPDTKKGILVKLHFIGKDLQKDKTEIIPIGIKNYGEAYLR